MRKDDGPNNGNAHETIDRFTVNTYPKTMRLGAIGAKGIHRKRVEVCGTLIQLSPYKTGTLAI